jgi:hypothetical protein
MSMLPDSFMPDRLTASMREVAFSGTFPTSARVRTIMSVTLESYRFFNAPEEAVAPRKVPAANEPLACCWSPDHANGMELLAGGAFTLCGAGLIFWGLSKLAVPAGPMEGMIFSIVGLGFLAVGLCLLLYRSLSGKQLIGITESGLEIIIKNTSRTYRWQDIHKILTMEFVPHVAAEPIMLVTIEPVSGSEIKFDTSFGGEPDLVLNYLASNCDYIVCNPRGYTKRTV